MRFPPPRLTALVFAAALCSAAPADRLRIEIHANGFERFDKPAEVRIEPGLTAAGAVPVQVTEVNARGKRLQGEVVWQYGPEPDRTLVILLKGRMAADETRRFDVRFKEKRRAKRTGPAPMPVEEVDYQEQPSLRIKTPAATYLFHKEGAGFASILDREGNDWIGYRPGHRSAGEFRGIPNLGDFAHPGYTGEKGAKSRVLEQGPLKVSVLSERHDGKYATRWDFFPNYARLTVLRHEKPYWFLYEGTPGGKLDEENDYYVFSNGERRPMSEHWKGDLPKPEWVYFADGATRRALFTVNHQNDPALDQFWPMEGNMTVFGYGRQYRCCGRYLDSSPAQFTIGLIEAPDHATAAAAIESAWRELKITVGKPGSRR